MRRLSAWYLRIRGWTFEGGLPDEPRFIVIAYPHTTNWDFFIFLAALSHFDLDAHFLGAKGLFVGPFGWYLRRMGGIPVDPATPGDSVRAAVDAFGEGGPMVLVLAPEGTRARTSRWRTGFSRIADALDLPVVMAYIDGPTKRIGLGPAVRVAGDADAWMDAAREFYADKHGLKPHNRGPVSFEA